MPTSTKISILYKNLLEIATSEFKQVVASAAVFSSQSGEPWKLRIYLCDGSFLDIYYSIKGRYSYHWDRRLVDGTIFRHDNAPHRKWNVIPGFPKHFHDGSEDNVVMSSIPENPKTALRIFLRFVSEHITHKLR